MIKKILTRLPFSITITVCMFLGALFGTVTAYADVIPVNLSVGTSTYTTYHSDSVFGRNWYYGEQQRITMSADKTTVTFLTSTTGYSTTYFSGFTNDDTICYGPLYIWDECGNHSVYYGNFLMLPIGGHSYYSGTYWYYNNLNSTNKIVNSQQIVVYSSGDGWTPLGSDYTCYITQ